MAMNRQRKTSNINNIVQYDASGNVTLAQIPLATTAASHVIISDNRAVKYRTVAQFYSDLGFPVQTGQNGKILSTNGSTLSWIENSGITGLTGDVTATGPGVVAATISSATITGKTLTGLAITGTAVTSSDSILTAIGKLQNQVNGLTGTLIYKGSWNATTNTPSITSGVGVAGNFYIVTVAGNTTIDGVSSWAVGDWIIFSGSVWQKVPNTNTVTSVNTYTGAVVLKTDDIAESATPTNLWFTNLRARGAISITTNNSSGASTYDSATGVINIPSYTLVGLGGFTNPMTTLGDLMYGGASGVPTRLVGNTTTSKRFLAQTGDGTLSAAPSWGTVVDSDITFSNRNPNVFFAGPSSGAVAAAPSWRAIVAADIPTLNQDTTGSAGSVANAITFNNAGTGAVSGSTFNGSVARIISFNSIGAQKALTLTTDNTSGAATLNVNGTLNIPQYQAALTFGNLTEATSSVLTIVGGTGAIIGSGTTIQVKQASGSQNGFLSSTDWTTFNNKQNALTDPVTGTGTAGQVAYWAASGITGSARLTFGPTAQMLLNNTVTAASAIARGLNITSTLVAAANNDVTVAVDIAPTFTNSSFTGVTNLSLRVSGNIRFSSITSGILKTDATGTVAKAVAGTDFQSPISLTTTGNSGVATFSSNTLNIPNYTLAGLGGMANPMTTLGDIIYGAASGAPARLAGNTAASKRFLSQTGDGTASAAPSWTALVSGDIPNNAANTSGNAGTATKLATARAINGVDFDGSAAITITANTGSSITFNNGGAGAASGTTFNGSAARTISYNTIGAPATDGTNASGTWGIDISGQVVKTVAAGSDANWLYGTIGSNDYFRVRAGGASNAGYLEIATSDDGTEPIYIRQYTGIFATIARTATILDGSGNTSFPGTLTASNFSGSSSGTNTGDQTNISGNAGTATSLQTARTLTIGDTGKSFNGTSNVSWSLAEIGAQAAGSYVTISGYQNITGYKEFSPYTNGNKTGFLCNNVTTGFMFMKNVDINKTWDWEILDNGTLNLNESGVSPRFMLYAGGGGRVFGNLTANGFFESSDIRYKEVLHTNPVVDLSSIDVIKYKFTDDISGQVRYGYSAQDVQSVCADLVSEKDERLYLNYSDVHTLKIAALEKRVKELELKLGL
jgi:hypothetical protein